jgi:ribosomal protein L23
MEGWQCLAHWRASARDAHRACHCRSSHHAHVAVVFMQARFKTTPDVSKLELREFFEKVYGLPVISLSTAIVSGRLYNTNASRSSMDSKRPSTATSKQHRAKKSDYKKVWVTFARGQLTQDGIVA